MPARPLSPCRYPGCSALVQQPGYCDAHRRTVQRESEARRESSSKRGYSSAWRRAREQFLREHPFCVKCMQEHRMTTATDVDHIVPHRGDMTLFWDRSNWQSLCHPHHAEKTAREDGGFGNATSAGGRGKV